MPKGIAVVLGKELSAAFGGLGTANSLILLRICEEYNYHVSN